MKFEIKNRFTRAVQFTAEIEDSGNNAVNIALAVKWSIINGANLRGANLRGANLRNADLRNADLSHVDLRHVNLHYADLSGADLSGADLRHAGLIILQLPVWTAYITKDHVRISCLHHTHEEWCNFTDEQINNMDAGALEWWKIHKPLVMAGIDAVKAQSK